MNRPKTALGVAAPRYLTKRGRGRTLGPELAGTARLLGVRPYPWQREVADVALEQLRGRWRYPRVTITTPRQSGKSTLIKLLAAHRCLSMPGSQVHMTAQTRSDATSRWSELVQLLRESSLVELTSVPRALPAEGWDFRVRATTGSEAIQFANGSSFKVFSPVERALHGSVSDLVIVDEARFFGAAEGAQLMAAAQPSMLTRNAQLLLVSTQGGPSSEFLQAAVDAGRRAVGDPAARVCYAEWAVDPGLVEAEDADLLELAWHAHPAAGQRGGPRFTAMSDAFEALGRAEFVREYGNIASSAADVLTRFIGEAVWARSTWQGVLPAAVDAVAVDISRDRRSASIAGCCENVLSLIEHRGDELGAAWVGPRLLELVAAHRPAALVIDGRGPSAALAADLAGADLGGTVLMVTSTPDLAAASAGLFDGLAAWPPETWHQPDPTLDESAERAQPRRMAAGWAFDRDVCGTPLLAATLAAWGARHAPARIEPSRIWV